MGTFEQYKQRRRADPVKVEQAKQEMLDELRVYALESSEDVEPN